jgi:hypothetical protein
MGITLSHYRALVDFLSVGMMEKRDYPKGNEL